MVLVNYTTRELTAKLVFYGPGLCGKTTNLQYIFDNLLPTDRRGKMVSLSTETDRTLFFDFLPLDIGTIRGLKTRLQLYTVPGQVHYNATRKIVLKGADGIVFVADSQRSMREANLESYKNMKANLAEHGLDIKAVQHVFQFNKRDLPDVMPLEQMEADLNENNVPFFEASAIQGIGVEDTLKAITKLVLKNLAGRFQSDAQAAAPEPKPAAVGDGLSPTVPVAPVTPARAPSAAPPAPAPPMPSPAPVPAAARSPEPAGIPLAPPTPLRPAAQGAPAPAAQRPTPPPPAPSPPAWAAAPLPVSAPPAAARPQPLPSVAFALGDGVSPTAVPDAGEEVMEIGEDALVLDEPTSTPEPVLAPAAPAAAPAFGFQPSRPAPSFGLASERKDVALPPLDEPSLELEADEPPAPPVASPAAAASPFGDDLPEEAPVFADEGPLSMGSGIADPAEIAAAHGAGPFGTEAIEPVEAVPLPPPAVAAPAFDDEVPASIPADDEVPLPEVASPGPDVLLGDTVLSVTGELEGLATEADLPGRRAAAPPAPAAPAVAARTPVPAPVAAPAPVPVAAPAAAAEPVTAIVAPLSLGISLGAVQPGTTIERTLEVPVELTDASGKSRKLILQVAIKFRIG